jgi:serine/threonine protein kinase
VLCDHNVDSSNLSSQIALVLINSDGYVVLVDFGFAKVVHDKTYTTCGSPEYMAPEICKLSY